MTPNSKVKIAYDPQIFLHQRFGGVSRYFARVAECLHGSGEDVRIFAPVYRNAYVDGLPPGIVRGTRIPTAWGRFSRWIDGPNMRVAQAGISRWKPDLVHETFFRSGRPYAKGIPTVLTVYDMIHEMFPDQFSVKDRTTARKRLAVERADHVICISHQTKDDLMRLFGVPEERVSVVHLGFDELVSGPSRIEPAGGSRPFVLYVGQRGGYKNFGRLLEAFGSSARLRPALDLVAFGGGPFTPQEKNAIAAAGLDENRVKQLGGSDEVLADLYRSARVFAYPSLYEGFGLPPLEAMSAGCPVVASDRSCIPEVLGDAARYFDPESPEAMRDALEQIVFDESQRSGLVRLGFERLKLFSWEKCARETLSTYQSLI